MVMLAALGMACGCQSQPESTHPSQRYELGEVKRRLNDLQPGATRMEVLLALGSPAERRPDAWIYLPSRSGLIVPADALVIHFRGGLYSKHEFRPIILGEQIGMP
jgi:hypothetical protein